MPNLSEIFAANPIGGESMSPPDGNSEIQRRQSQKMEAIGRLAGGIAHDFNNQLFIINGYSELLRQRIGCGHPLLPLVDEVFKAGQRAAQLTGRLLAFSRQQLLSPRSLDLNRELRELEELLPRLIGEDIVVQLDLQADVWEVFADPVQLEQVVFNLAANSRDAMPQGGWLRLATRNFASQGAQRSDSEALAGTFVELTIEDNGVGMDREVLSHIFEPFFSTKEGNGTGLGLATVYGIVRQSGGWIEVDSTVGVGTRFRIYIPTVDLVGSPDGATDPAVRVEAKGEGQ